VEVLAHQDHRLALGERHEEVAGCQEGLVPDLLRAGVLQAQVPVVPEAEGEEVAQQRPHLLTLFLR